MNSAEKEVTDKLKAADLMEGANADYVLKCD